jgi:hypothetical protein
MDASTYSYDCPPLAGDLTISAAEAERWGIIVSSKHTDDPALLVALADAACTYYVTSGGQGGDALMRAAKAVWEARQTRP